jgi:hypothetical protein
MRLSASLFFAIAVTVVLAQRRTGASPPRPDPFADPKNDPYNPLRYIATNSLTATAFGLVLLVGILQSLCIWKWGAKWMSSMTIGAYTFALGIALRFGLHEQPQSRGLYIAEYLFVVLSPCAFIAATYVLLGRLAVHLQCGRYLPISTRRITIVFVSSDVITFLIQATGGAMTASANNLSLAKVGSRLFLAGLALQLLSYLIFTGIFIRFLFLVHTHEPEVLKLDAVKAWYNDWRTLAAALIVSCIGILIRSVYRTIELGQGYHGYLAIHEVYFYTLDTLPLFIAIAIFVPAWPGRFIRASETAPQVSEKAHVASTESSLT